MELGENTIFVQTPDQDLKVDWRAAAQYGRRSQDDVVHVWHIPILVGVGKSRNKIAD